MENRITKFRAWDGSLKKFVNPTYHNTSLSDLFELPFYKFTQFTGLTDCNGLEVYEYDRLKDPESDDSEEYYLVVWDNKQAKFRLDLYGNKMYFNEGGGEEFTNDVELIDEDCNEITAVGLFEVSGNDFENV